MNILLEQLKEAVAKNDECMIERIQAQIFYLKSSTEKIKPHGSKAALLAQFAVK